MIKTEYDVGQMVNLQAKVTSVTVKEDGIFYRLEIPRGEAPLKFIMAEEQMMGVECISVDDYETEINSLKDEVNRQKEMYYLEHIKYMKLKTGAKNDEWRLP